MKVNSTTSTSSPQTIQPVAEPPLLAAARDEITSIASRNTMSWQELKAIVFPLPAFVAAHSGTSQLDPTALYDWDHIGDNNEEVRVCFRLDERFLYLATTLDEVLIALLRASGHRQSRSLPLRIGLNHSCNANAGYYSTNLILVISTSTNARREACLEHVNLLLRIMARPGYIQPLNNRECEVLGRARVHRE